MHGIFQALIYAGALLVLGLVAIWQVSRHFDRQRQNDVAARAATIDAQAVEIEEKRLANRLTELTMSSHAALEKATLGKSAAEQTAQAAVEVAVQTDIIAARRAEIAALSEARLESTPGRVTLETEAYAEAMASASGEVLVPAYQSYCEQMRNLGQAPLPWRSWLRT